MALNYIEIMNELVEEAIPAVKEIIEEQVKPIIEYRVKLEKKIADKAIEELETLEKDEVSRG